MGETIRKISISVTCIGYLVIMLIMIAVTKEETAYSKIQVIFLRNIPAQNIRRLEKSFLY